MKELNNLFFATIFAIIIMRLFTSCNGNTSFNPDELKFVNPFEDTSVAVYKSATGKMDTVKFFKRKIDTIKYRSVEQGFYNENALTVGYELTSNSFHKITVISINKEPENFLLFLKAKNSHSSKEISFLGLLFDEDYLNKIIDTKETSIVFSQDNAKYKGININEGIKSFKFDFDKGIVSFIDKNNIEWVRIKM